MVWKGDGYYFKTKFYWLDMTQTKQGQIKKWLLNIEKLKWECHLYEKDIK